jgi:GTPase SAR1 family protein
VYSSPVSFRFTKDLPADTGSWYCPCFALNDLSSFQSIDYWLGRVEKLAEPGVSLILAGNKSDFATEREVMESQIHEYAKLHHLEYMETSDKRGTRVRELFEQLMARIQAKRANGELGAIREIPRVGWSQSEKKDKRMHNQSEARFAPSLVLMKRGDCGT